MNSGSLRSVEHLSHLRRSPFVSRRPSRLRTVRTFAAEGSRQPWDFGRFVKTVLFFNDPFKNLSKIFAQPTISKPETVREESRSNLVQVFGPMATSASPVLLLGAETPIGRCILEGMTKNGMFIRAVVPDAQKARTSFETLKRTTDSSLEVLEWTSGSSRIPDLGEDGSVVICESLDPYMTLLSQLLEGQKVVYSPSRGVGSISWGPLDDVVMGGCSQSELTIQQGKGETSDYAAVFSGNITSANSGGFASVRTKNFEPALNFSGYDGLRLRVRGDGQRYKFMLRTSDDWDGVSFCQSFDTKEGWNDVDLPFKDFFPVFRARSVKPAPSLSLDSITSLQLMLSKFEYDGDLNPSVRMGRFELPIEHISIYTEKRKVPHVVLIGGSDADQKQLKTMATTYTIIQPDSTQEAAMKDSTFVSFCVASLSEKAALNATFKEKTRALWDGELAFDRILKNFSKD